MEEENFPRGGPKTSKRKLTDQKEVQDLFKTHDAPSKKKPKSNLTKKEKKTAEKKVKLKKEKSIDQFRDTDNAISILTVKSLSSGMLLYGLIKEIHDYHLVVSLPNGLRGNVSITNVCHAYTSVLESLTAPDAHHTISPEDIGGLGELFHIGQPVRCKVIEVAGGDKKGHYRIRLSVNPAEVNVALSPSNLKNGMVLSACVASCEDHGYVLDIGIKGVTAFLRNHKAEKYVADYKDEEPLKVGSYLSVVVDGGDSLERMLGEGRAFNVDVDPTNVNKSKLTEAMGVTMHSLLPGMSVEAAVTKVEKAGIRVKFLTYKGWIHHSHLTKTTAKYEKGETFQATVMFVHPGTKAVTLTLLQHLVSPHLAPRKLFGDLQIGTVVENARVFRMDKARGVYVNMGEDLVGMAYLRDLSDSEKTDIGKEFQIGTTHNCRILDFDYVDRVVVVTFKKSILEKQFMQMSDIQPGMVMEGAIKTIEKKGVVVRITKTMNGFIHNMHLSDVPLKQVEKVFSVGQRLTCRAMTVNVQKKKLMLTSKKSLVFTKLPVVTNYEQLSSGVVVEGTVIQIISAGLLVAFYNNVKGLIPKKELGEEGMQYPEQMFQVGQLIKTQVINVVPERKRLILSLALTKKSQDAKPVKERKVPEDFGIGKSAACRVKEVKSQGLDMVLLHSGAEAYLPMVHLSDLPALNDLMAHTLHKNDIIKEGVYLQGGKSIVSFERR